MSFQNCKIEGVGVNPAEYHNQQVKRGDNLFPISPSALNAFRKCPSRWLAGYQREESASLRTGSLFDCRLLTPEQLPKRYAVQPVTYTNDKGETKPWAWQSNTCKAWGAEQRKAGREIASTDDLMAANSAAARYMADPVIRDWHNASDTQVLVTGEYQDEITGLVVPVRCLLDYAPRIGTEFELCLGDLKTARSGELVSFVKSVYLLGYHVQAAFDLALYNAATGEKRNTWCWLGIENEAPWEPFKRMASPEFLDIGRQQMLSALQAYCRCLSRGQWPGYDDHPDAVQGWSVCEPLPWMAYEAASDKLNALVQSELTVEQTLEVAGL